LTAAPKSATTLHEKFIENYFKDVFSRPFLRRLKYMYFGLEHDDDLFLLSDTEDTDFTYCDSMQTTGLVKITNPDHRALIRSWFATLGIDGTVPTLVYLTALITLLGKLSWNAPETKFTRLPSGALVYPTDDTKAIIVARPCEFYFSLSKLQGYLERYRDVFFDETQPSYVLPLPPVDNPNQLRKVPVDSAALYQAGVIDTPCLNPNLMLIPGLDMLLTKSLQKKDVTPDSGIRIWAESSLRSLNYGGFFMDPDVSMCVVRDNIFLFPKPIRS
jgi:hypothetical protein